jgi:formiminotetrahydrofolate cyclodeaminase
MSAEAGTAAIRAQTVEDFLDALASDSPTPGGGAVAAVAGAAGAALIAMVCRLTIDKKGYEDAWERCRAILPEAEDARAAFLELADRDASAFDDVMAAFKLPKGTAEEKAARSIAIQRGYETAAAVPLEIAQRAVAAMRLARDVTEIGNAHAASDGASAAQMLSAAARCAILNVEINAAALKDGAKMATLRAEVNALHERAAELLDAADEAFAARVH